VEITVDRWLLPRQAVEQFAPPDLVQGWRTDPSVGSFAYQQIAENLRSQLLEGRLIARGTPHYGTAQDDSPVVISPAQWQSLRLAGADFSVAASSVGPMQSYDNLEIGKSARYIIHAANISALKRRTKAGSLIASRRIACFCTP